MVTCTVECKDVSAEKIAFAQHNLSRHSKEFTDNFLLALAAAEVRHPDVSQLSLVDMETHDFLVLPIACYRCLAAKFLLDNRDFRPQRRNISRR